MLKCPRHLLNYLLWVSKCYSFLMLHVFICSQAFSGKGLVTWRIIKNFQKEMTSNLPLNLFIKVSPLDFCIIKESDGLDIRRCFCDKNHFLCYGWVYFKRHVPLILNHIKSPTHDNQSIKFYKHYLW